VEDTLFISAAAWPGSQRLSDRVSRPDRSGSPGRRGRTDGRARPVILGVPLDRTTSYRSGTADGPRAVRRASWSLETYSPVLDRDLEDTVLYDAGDVELRSDASIEDDLGVIERAVTALRASGLVPVIIGGEHLVSLPIYRAVAGLGAGRGDRSCGAGGPAGDRAGVPPAVFHYDAHADLRQDFEGAELSHATVFRRVAELAGSRNLWQFGIRSGERVEMAWGRANVNRPPGTLLEATRLALGAVAGRAIYLSIDIDVLDPAQAPGTGNPEPDGPTAGELFEVVRTIGRAAEQGTAGGGIDLVGVDLVEVSPGLDPSGRTQIVAAKLLRELILSGFPPEV